MTDLPRLKPDPIPAIYPVPEYLAEGELREIYEDTKAILQTPWMGVIAMAYAHYPTFYGRLWQGLRETFASAALVEACTDLRRDVEARVARAGSEKCGGSPTSVGSGSAAKARGAVGIRIA